MKECIIFLTPWIFFSFFSDFDFSLERKKAQREGTERKERKRKEKKEEKKREEKNEGESS